MLFTAPPYWTIFLLAIKPRMVISIIQNNRSQILILNWTSRCLSIAENVFYTLRIKLAKMNWKCEQCKIPLLLTYLCVRCNVTAVFLDVVVIYSYLLSCRISRKKDRSSSGGAFEFPSSPSVSRRSHKEKQSGNYSRLRLNPNTVTTAHISELTVFHIPGLDVKV